MKDLWGGFTQALKVIRGDKVIVLLGIIPLVIGIICYALLWSWPFRFALKQGDHLIEQYLSIGNLSGIFYYLLMGILLVAFWWLLNWTFVLLVAFLATPFNDMISERVERSMKGVNLPSMKESYAKMIKGLGAVMINEIKKISLIFCLSLMAFLLSWIPLLIPVSVILSALLMSVNFLDYSWCRHRLKLKECVADIKSSPLLYSMAGGIFLFLVSIPLVNLLIPCGATVYYTVLFNRQKI